MHIHHVVVDGSNIATEARSMPSLAQLDEAVKAFLAEFDVDKLSVIVDATFGHRIDADERAEFDQAIANGELVTPPAGAIGRGDAFVLQAANRVDAVILSNDSFQEFHGEYPWLFDEGRLMGGKPVPGVGWVFLHRTPVRGPASRRSQRDAKRKRTTGPSESPPETAGSASSSGRRRSRRSQRSTGEVPAPSATDRQPAEESSAGRRRKRGRRPKTETMVNDALPFIEFVGAHPVDTEVEGTVSEFSSHGAYVTVGEARCYLPLHAMGEPAPRRARDVVSVGEAYRFVVTRLDPPRRGIDVRLVSDQAINTKGTDEKEKLAKGMGGGNTRRRTKAASHVPPEDSADALDIKVDATTNASERNLEEDQVAVKKATKKAAKKPAKKTAKKAVKKAPAKKPAKKATKKAVKKAPAKKATKKATKKAVKKAPAKKATKKTAKKAVKKAPAKKAAKKTAKKAVKKAPAKKAAKKATKKAPARRR